MTEDYSIKEDVRGFISKITRYRAGEREEDPLETDERKEFGERLGKNMNWEYAADILTLLDDGRYGEVLQYARDSYDSRSSAKEQMDNF